MFKFFWKSIVLAVLTLSVTISAGILLPEVPATQPNADIAFSYDYFREHKSEVNTLFIGSSRFLQQVSPRIFDEILASDHGITSYSLSAAGFFSPATYTFLKALLLSPPPKLKYVVFEFDVKNQPILKNLHSPRFYAGYAGDETKMLITSLWRESIGFLGKVENTYYHLVSFVEKKMNFGSFPLALSRKLEDISPPVSDVPSRLVDLGPDRDGFFVFEDVVAAYPERTHLIERHQRLVDNPKKLRKRLIETRAEIEYAKKNSQPNEIVLNYLADLDRMARERGVELFFVMTPKRGKDYNKTFATFYALPDRGRIDHLLPRSILNSISLSIPLTVAI